ncbi:hypothetical protein [Pseudonocardia sp. TRM90224]|uniref:hypothetical protein n=1 Tax=Pseudonocardia sp. TRM90224 TaxID=2812678 RepID=UPI001E5CE938|nr:hypothetical protein [Pseudonocardia sp. TRM90224]
MTTPTARRLTAAVCVAFAGLAVFVSSGAGVQSLRTVPLALTAPRADALTPAGGTAGNVEAAPATDPVHAWPSAAGSIGGSIASTGPDVAATPDRPAHLLRRPVAGHGPAPIDVRSVLLARAPPLHG